MERASASRTRTASHQCASTRIWEATPRPAPVLGSTLARGGRISRTWVPPRRPARVWATARRARVPAAPVPRRRAPRRQKRLAQEWLHWQVNRLPGRRRISCSCPRTCRCRKSTGRGLCKPGARRQPVRPLRGRHPRAAEARVLDPQQAGRRRLVRCCTPAPTQEAMVSRDPGMRRRRARWTRGPP